MAWYQQNYPVPADQFEPEPVKVDHLYAYCEQVSVRKMEQ